MYKLYLIGLLTLTPVLRWCFSAKSYHTTETGKTITATHFNILFAPDMSNRVNPALYRRPLSDADILSIITNDLYPSILRYRRVENQKDKLTVDFINKGLINQYAVNTDKLLIDFGRFPNQKERIDYIKDRSPRTLKKDINEMTTEFSRINSLAIQNNVGADIWSYLNQGIDETKVLTAENAIRYGSDTYVNTYRNILILPTDGYIEAGIFGKGFDLSKNTVNHFRDAFLKSGEESMEQFLEKNKKFQIRPVSNEHLKNVEVLVMELYDRSLSNGGYATVHPTDMEIIKLLWTNWLQQSGVKRFELHPYVGSRDEAEKVILNFIGVSKII